MVIESGPAFFAPATSGWMAMPANGLFRPLVKFDTNTSASSGVPSWKVMPGRSVTVHFVWSAFGVIDWAR